MLDGLTYRKAMPFILAVYFVGVAGALLYFNFGLKLETVAIILFVAALLTGRAFLFLRDWGPFFIVLVAWQVTAPLATEFNFPWHVLELIDADKTMFFGTVPAVWLQQHLHHSGVLEPWDVFAAVMYMLHFLAPLVAGFALWLTNRQLFHRFAIAFVLVALAGFLTYIIYPAVPPWMASEHLIKVGHKYFVSQKGLHGVVYLKPGATNLFHDIMGQWYNPNKGTITVLQVLHLRYNQVAAMPSEHAAFPLLFFLFLRRQFGGWGYIALAYVVGLLFSITYLGQHYVIDAVVGFTYALIVYGAVMHLAPYIARRVRARRGPPQRHEIPALGRAELEEA